MLYSRACQTNAGHNESEVIFKVLENSRNMFQGKFSFGQSSFATLRSCPHALLLTHMCPSSLSPASCDSIFGQAMGLTAGFSKVLFHPVQRMSSLRGVSVSWDAKTNSASTVGWSYLETGPYVSSYKESRGGGQCITLDIALAIGWEVKKLTT